MTTCLATRQDRVFFDAGFERSQFRNRWAASSQRVRLASVVTVPLRARYHVPKRGHFAIT